MFGPNQVGELLIGNAIATETQIGTFTATATDKKLQIVAANGTTPTSGEVFKVLQATSGSTAKGLNYEFSDNVNPIYVEKVTVTKYAAEVAKAVQVTGFATAGVVAAKRTYIVEIRVQNELSPENFEVVSGYYVTGEVLGSDTATTVVQGLVDSLNKRLALRGNSEFTISSVAGTSITVTEQIQNNVPGKIVGRKLVFDVNPKVFDNTGNGYNSNLGLLTATQTVAPTWGNGTGKWATNYEWFCKGYKYDPDRLTGYPADFGDRTPYYATKAGQYNVINVYYYAPRKETSLERQYKLLTIAVDADPTWATTNALLQKLRDFGVVGVPADLA